MARLCSQPGVVLLLRVCFFVCVLRGMLLCFIVLSLAFNQCLGQPETNNMRTGSSSLSIFPSPFACVAAGETCIKVMPLLSLPTPWYILYEVHHDMYEVRL